MVAHRRDRRFFWVGESPVYLNWKLNVNLLRLFIDKNLGLELKYFKLKFFWVNNYDNTRKELKYRKMLQIKGSSIKLTRGDDAVFSIDVYQPDGTLYTPSEG